MKTTTTILMIRVLDASSSHYRRCEQLVNAFTLQTTIKDIHKCINSKTKMSSSSIPVGCSLSKKRSTTTVFMNSSKSMRIKLGTMVHQLQTRGVAMFKSQTNSMTKWRIKQFPTHTSTSNCSHGTNKTINTKTNTTEGNYS